MLGAHALSSAVGIASLLCLSQSPFGNGLKENKQRDHAVVAQGPASQPAKPGEVKPGDSKQGDAKPGIAWEGDFDAAIAKAKKENKSVYVVFIMDDEPGNDEMVKTHFADGDVLELSKKMICLVGCTGDHKPDPAKPTPPGMCPKFGNITCEQHRAVEKKARAKYIKTDVVRAPQEIFCNTFGQEVLRKVYLISKQELRKAMAVAIHAQGRDAAAAAVVNEEKAHVDELLKVIASGNVEARESAFRELATSDDPRGLAAVIEKATSAGADVARAQAVRGLGVKGNYAAIKPLLSLVKDNNNLVQISAIDALASIELPEAGPELMKILQMERATSLKGHEIRALAKSWPESAEVRKICIEFLQNSPATVTRSALWGLFHLKSDPKITAAVLPLLNAKVTETRMLAAWVVGKQRDKAAANALEKMCKDDNSVEVREFVVKPLSYAKGNAVPNYDTLCSVSLIGDEL